MKRDEETKMKLKKKSRRQQITVRRKKLVRGENEEQEIKEE